uniref:SFRICE_030151 n=1 Tax=Spodoptera frugiperda TaxID=7108 RepID=A0A2H1WM90_SPOFR
MIRKKPSNTLPDLGIVLETPCSAFALTTTRPTRQSLTTFDKYCFVLLVTDDPHMEHSSV